MKNKFNNFWKYFAGGGTILSYQAWWDRIQNKNSAQEMKVNIGKLQNSIDNLSSKIENCQNHEEKTKLIIEQNNAKNSLDNLWDIHEKYINKAKDVVENSDKSKELFEQYTEQFSNAFKLAENKSEVLEKSIKNIKNFMEDTPIVNTIEKFKEYLSTLSTIDLCLLMNIFISVFIFTCLVSILLAFYGNYLIEKLSLEEKYPKLSSIIRLRVKLQHYYVIINTIFIVIALILLIYVNVITFLYG